MVCRLRVDFAAVRHCAVLLPDTHRDAEHKRHSLQLHRLGQNPMVIVRVAVCLNCEDADPRERLAVFFFLKKKNARELI